MKYSEKLTEWLSKRGYTRCFFVAGGNIMHLLESASQRFACTATIHEVAAGVAAEYFNEVSEDERAFVMVTAGPGLTNMVTAVAGAFLESRELLILGGQVKVSDLSRGALRQRGIQEIDGVSIVAPICVKAVLMDDVLDEAAFVNLIEASAQGRKGPVFVELPLDIQGRPVSDDLDRPKTVPARAAPPPGPSAAELDKLVSELRRAERPVLLLGGGVVRATTRGQSEAFTHMGIPVTTTWNAMDRLGADHPMYAGRPNTWGQRSANLIMQQADLLVALGTRLSLQQTGFNWQEFVPNGRVAHVDVDAAELTKGHPRVDLPMQGDANRTLKHLFAAELGDYAHWRSYCDEVRAALPLVEDTNQTRPEYLSPFDFCTKLSDFCGPNDVIVPCSSGGAFTVMMQTFLQKEGQTIVTNKGLASMGYGLSGAIGAALAAKGRRTVLVEGDGGFSQNLQEIGTAAINKLNLKMFVFDDSGYASIRMTQRNYFGGRYVGCDTLTGLGLPNWEKLFDAYDVPSMRVGPGFESDPSFAERFNAEGPAAFIVSIDPEQTYFPKIMSRVAENGGMVSNPLHKMSPFLDDDMMRRVGKYLTDEK